MQPYGLWRQSNGKKSRVGVGSMSHLHSSALAWEIHGRRSLVGCSPWGLEESDTTERLHFHIWLYSKEMVGLEEAMEIKYILCHLVISAPEKIKQGKWIWTNQVVIKAHRAGYISAATKENEEQALRKSTLDKRNSKHVQQIVYVK